MSARKHSNKLLKQQEQQFCKDFERLTLLLATVGRPKPAIQQIVSENLKLTLQPCHTGTKDFEKQILSGCNVNFFEIESDFIFAYIPLDNVLSRKRLNVEVWFTSCDNDSGIFTKSSVAPVVSALSAESRLNSNLSGIWAICRKPSPSTIISSLTIVQSFSNHPRSIQSIKINPKHLEEMENPFTDFCSRKQIEVLIEFHLLYDARAAVDAEKYPVESLKSVLDAFVSNGNFKEYEFDGFYCFFGGGSDEFSDSMVFLPDWSEQATWSIYDGDHVMPKRIYITARNTVKLDKLLKLLDWPKGVTLEIRAS